MNPITPDALAGTLDFIAFSVADGKGDDLLRRWTFRIDDLEPLGDDPRRSAFADEKARPRIDLRYATQCAMESLPLAPRIPADKRQVACFRMFNLHVRPELRGLGIANVLLELAHRQCATSAAMDGLSVVSIFIDPDPFTYDDDEPPGLSLEQLRDWYRRRGYRGFPSHPVGMWRCVEIRPKAKP